MTTPPILTTTTSFPVPQEELGTGATRMQLRAAWAAARAKNALRHRALVMTVSGTTLVLSLLTLILVPRQASRAARLAAPRPGEKVDTNPLVATERAARTRVAAADSALAAKRASAVTRVRVAPPRPVVAAVGPSPADAVRRDSLAGAITALERLLSRTRTSPLPSSYRALADAPELRADARVRALVDSLDDVEREREAFGVVSGVDPIYVQLTNRVTQLGRAIAEIAERRQATIQEELTAAYAAAPPADSAAAPATLPPPTPSVATPAVPAVVVPLPPPAPVIVDTTAEVAARDSARLRLAGDSTRLAAARAQNQSVDQRVAAARDRADLDAPPEAMLVAAIALALVAGFGSALAREVRRPRVADAREAERVTRTRVLAVVRPDPAPPERDRRRADEQVPELIDPATASYRLLYLSLAATGAAVPVITIVGDDPGIAATIVANLAAAGATDGRGTFVVDADLGRAAASVALGLGLRLGLAELLRGAVKPADAIRGVAVGRGITVDVLPAGVAGPSADPSALGALTGELRRLAGRYDFTVVSAPPVELERDLELERGSPTVLVAPDVIVCARTGHTPLTRLAREITRLRDLGATVRGIVLWDDDVPQVATLAELKAA